MLMPRFPLNKAYWSIIQKHCCRSKPTLTAAIFYRSSSKKSYYVLLPEVPSDTAATNALLRESDLPHFDELDAEKCYKGIAKHALDHEAGIFEIERHIKETPEPITFSSLFEKLEKLTAPLSFAWGTVKNLYLIQNNKLTAKTYMRIHQRANSAFCLKFGSSTIYSACKDIYEKQTNLTAFQKRVVARLMLEGELNGIALEEDKNEHFNGTYSKIRKLESLYRHKLQVSSERFSYRIIDYGIVKDLPDRLLMLMADNINEYKKGPWTVTHKPYVFHDFMKYCPHKDLRLNAWKAYIIRSSNQLDPQLSSGREVTDIRDWRHTLAKQLGFESFAHMSMETKMAGSVDNVLAVLNDLFVKAKDKQLEELKSLKEFAEKNGFRGELEECDVPFWRRRQMLDISNRREQDFDSHFPFSHVWTQLLELCSNLFDIRFEDATSKVNTWHSDVKFYNILDSNGNKMSSFYIDPFKREHKGISLLDETECVVLRGRCDSVGNLPLISMIFNFNEPLPNTNKESLLSVEDVTKLFKQFGYALQELLSSVPYLSISGHANVEWDAVDVSSHFLLFWLQEPSVVEKISKHYISGSPLSKEGVAGFTKAMSHMSAHDLCNDLFLSLLDIRLYTDDMVFYEVFEELWKKHIPFSYDRRNSLPCWFEPIICDKFPAAYYSCWWSKMVAADVFRAFKECQPHEITDVGKRYRDTFLSLGGGCNAAEVFRKFRGRDPVPEALLTVLGIS